MQYTVMINQSKACEWGLNAQQAMLFAFVYGVPSWAKPVTKGGEVFYALSKAKIVEELPLLTDKPDTAYRLLRALQDKGLVELSSTNQITLVRLTDAGKTWNQKSDGSEKYPSEVGEKSVLGRKNIRSGSEESPTNHVTSNQVTNHDTSNHNNPAPSDDVAELFDFWKTQMGKTYKVVLTDKRRRQIGKALKDYPLDLLKQAIIGCTLSPYHMGQNDAGKRYDDIELIVRDAKHVEQFVGYFEQKPKNVSLYSDRPRPVHTGLDQANDTGLTRRADGTYSL